MQVSLNAEMKGKADAVRQKKKLEADVNELEIALEHVKRNHADALNSVKKQQQSHADLQCQIEDEQRQRAEVREQLVAAERHANQLVAELHELQVSGDHFCFLVLYFFFGSNISFRF